jgi:predicted transcriptional regulator
MPKESHHPKAYLQQIKNVRNGVLARTKILDVLDRGPFGISAISEETSQSYGVILHHLRLLEAEGSVTRAGKKPYSWVLTGIGQRRLVL